jgi:hypothetical protein
MAFKMTVYIAFGMRGVQMFSAMSHRIGLELLNVNC